MDESDLTEKPKKQKLNEEQDIVDGNRKCLRNLPEEILQYIISLLPTKDAVRTSIVCKRWEYLWTSIPNLDFHGLDPANRTLYTNVMERALVLRECSNIKQFTLTYYVVDEVVLVSGWISAAVRRNVQEMYIDLNSLTYPFSLPHSLFTCVTLTKLELGMRCTLKLPPTICFSNLKSLIIAYVTFWNDYSTQKFFSGLPVLQELDLYHCNWKNLKVVSINSAPKLQSIRITEVMETKNPGDGCQVMISGVSLKEFYYIGEFYNEYCFNNTPLFVEASINANWSHGRERQVAHRMLKLLKGLSNIKDLKLSGYVVQVLTNVAELLPHKPMFNNLLYLAFDVVSVYIDSRVLWRILQNSPYLKTLKFTEGTRVAIQREDWILNPVPPCFISQLNCIEIGSYYGDEKQLFAVKILLKKAVILDKIVISCLPDFVGDLKKRVKICEQLLKLPRWSKNCELVLV